MFGIDKATVANMLVKTLIWDNMVVPIAKRGFNSLLRRNDSKKINEGNDSPLENGYIPMRASEDSPTYMLFISILKQDLESVKEYVKTGADLYVQVKNGRTALHVGACFDCLDIVQYIKEQRVGVNEKDKMGATALHLGAYYGHLSVVKYLLQQGAYINARDKAGSTVLMYSAIAGKLNCVKYLVQ